jgi:hypothetical protein
MQIPLSTVSNKKKHSPEKLLNTYFSEYLSGSTPTTDWYNEISSYDFSSPGYSDATGHFTQVVWYSSLQLGIGIAFNNDGSGFTVVANYYPAGNVIGAFPANVLPPCSNGAGGD